MAAIAGLISLGSCVKDDVSASVEAVRNAKANQLNAEAAYDNARAEHQRAISAAQVAHEQADAALAAANAKAQEMRNQVQAAALEAEIAKQIAIYEKDLAQAKADLQTELNNLEQAVRDAATAKYVDVATAIGDYNTALLAYTAAQKGVIAAKMRLETAKNNAAHAQEIKANAIAAWEQDIAKQEAYIASLKEIESEGLDFAQVKAEIAKLRAEIHNAMVEFGTTEEVKALVEAGQNLANTKMAFDLVSALSFEGVNAMVAEAFGHEYTPADNIGVWDPTAGAYTVAITENTLVSAGEKYWDYGTNSEKIQKTPWGGDYNGYFEAVGAKTIKSKVATTGYAFFDYTSYQYEYTADDYDENGVYKTDAGYKGPDGVMDSKPALVKAGAFALDGSNFQVKQYRVNELVKNAAEEYFTNLPNNTKTALSNGKKTLSNLEKQLGTDKDTEKTEYATGKKTHFAVLAQKKIDLQKAIEANDKAQSDLTGKPQAVKDAYDALYKVVDVKTVDKDKWINAVVTLAQAIEAAYGIPAYDPNKKTYTSPGNDQDAINYLYGVNGPKDASLNPITVTEMTDVKYVKLLFDDSDATGFKIVKTWSSKATKKDATEIQYVTDVANRDAKAVNVIAVAEKKAAELGDKNDKATTKQKAPGDPAKLTAYAEVKAQEEAIYGEFNKDNQLVTKGYVQAIAEQKDLIATKLQPEADEAESVKATYEAAVAAADVKAYDKAAKALEEAATAFNTAAAAVAAWEKENIIDKDAEVTALENAVKKQDLAAEIRAAEDKIAEDKQNIANWESTETAPGTFPNSAEAIIAQAEADLVDALATLASATADLKAAEAELEAIVGDLDIEYDIDDEPAEEPTDTPSEGGEGEGGDAEGGEAEGEGGEA